MNRVESENQSMRYRGTKKGRRNRDLEHTGYNHNEVKPPAVIINGPARIG